MKDFSRTSRSRRSLVIYDQSISTVTIMIMIILIMINMIMINMIMIKLT